MKAQVNNRECVPEQEQQIELPRLETETPDPRPTLKDVAEQLKPKTPDPTPPAPRTPLSELVIHTRSRGGFD